MQFTLDIHCHTVASGHAYSTVTENALWAKKMGLTHIGISDHAPAMPGSAGLYNFTNQWVLPDFIHGVRVFKGVEVNICDYDGKLDLPDWLLKDRMEFVIASLHRGVISTKDKIQNTQAIVRAMENPLVGILGHPGDVNVEIDFKEVVAAAARTGTIIEINNASLLPTSIRFGGDGPIKEIAELCKLYNVPVLASSDAHFYEHVGRLNEARDVIKWAGIDEFMVLNTDADIFLKYIKAKRENL